jgi:pimeloyl-ACP methyl ester carboxylesterase
VPDIRGRGRSAHSPDPRRYRPGVYARDIAALLDRAGIGRAIFIGTSMGGLIMLTLAAGHSRRMAAAILNDVGPEVDPAGIARILSYAGKGPPPSSWDEAAALAGSTNQAAFPDYGEADWAKVARRLFREEGGRIVADYDPAISVALAKPPPRFARPLAWLLFRRLARRRPTLLIRGALSDVMTDPIAQRMLRAAPRMEQAVVPGVGHAPSLAEPVALDAVTHFLARLP